MTDHEREHARLARLSGYRVNGVWNLFEKLVIDGKTPQDALRLAIAAFDTWTPWFEENHIEAPEPPDVSTQVEQAAAKVTDAIKIAMADFEAARNRQRWWMFWSKSESVPPRTPEQTDADSTSNQ